MLVALDGDGLEKEDGFMRLTTKWLAVVAGVLLASSAYAGFSITLGTNDFYLSVGNYDYYPYTYTAGPYGPPQISFYDVMGDYGTWVNVEPFGRVWRPYVSYGWRPYVEGHWVYTQYGPTWVGYEPWAWAAYHYGNWIMAPDYGWVWIPGYEWHPGRVMWSVSGGAIGWIPAPPVGYDYSRGYLAYRGAYNQFTYDDDDFENDRGYGGPYYNDRYHDLYYNGDYQGIAPQLWVFVSINNFTNENIYNCYFGNQYVQQIFVERDVRLTPRPLPRVYIEKTTHQSIREVAVQVKQLQVNNHRVQMVVPDGQQDVIRKHANEVVKQVIAPAFVENHKTFKGTESTSQNALSKVFHQDGTRPRVETVNSDDLLKQVRQQTEEKNRVRLETEKHEIDSVVKNKKNNQVRSNSDQATYNTEIADRQKDKNKDRQFEHGNQSTMDRYTTGSSDNTKVQDKTNVQKDRDRYQDQSVNKRTYETDQHKKPEYQVTPQKQQIEPPVKVQDQNQNNNHDRDAQFRSKSPETQNSVDDKNKQNKQNKNKADDSKNKKDKKTHEDQDSNTPS